MQTQEVKIFAKKKKKNLNRRIKVIAQRSRQDPPPQEHLRWRAWKQYFSAKKPLNVVGKLSILYVFEGPATSVNPD